MKIVQLLPELNEGGVERGVVELSRELVKLGHESIVISAGGKQVLQLEADGGRHILFDVCSKNPLTALTRVLRLRRLLRELRPDILHARSRVPAWLAWLANRGLRIPFVTTVHGFNSVNAYSRVMTFGDRVICVSTAIKDYIQKHYGVAEEKTTVIPRGIDLVVFDPEAVDNGFIASFRSRYQLEGKFVVTTVGRITQLKDVESFIKAIDLLRRNIPEVIGLVVGGVHEGKNNYSQLLHRLVSSLDLEKHVTFTGSQAKVAEIYALSDVVVSSSKKPESFGRAAGEALAMEVPVVATAHGGILDIVIDGETGRLFQPGDIRALAECIVDLRTRRLTGLRAFVTDRFTLERMVAQTVSVYRYLLDVESRS